MPLDNLFLIIYLFKVIGLSHMKICLIDLNKILIDLISRAQLHDFAFINPYYVDEF